MAMKDEECNSNVPTQSACSILTDDVYLPGRLQEQPGDVRVFRPARYGFPVVFRGRDEAQLAYCDVLPGLLLQNKRGIIDRLI